MIRPLRTAFLWLLSPQIDSKLPSSKEMDIALSPKRFLKMDTQKNSNRRRFTDEQIRILEYMFETESRPESQIVHHLAHVLGLQPRQISIWFQNRRARLKIKQVEKEYNKLKASHDALASSFDSLKRENQSLVVQLQQLKNLYAKQHGSRSCGLDQTRSNSINQRLENSGTHDKPKEKPGHLLEGYSNVEKTNGEESFDVFSLTGHGDVSMTSMWDWHSFFYE